MIGLCLDHDPDLWFADKKAVRNEAAAICKKCPVQLACLRHTLAMPELPEYGVWAGYEPVQLRSLVRRNSVRRPFKVIVRHAR